MATAGRALSIDRLHALVKSWQHDQAGRHDCPGCGVAGVTVVDASVRPHTEWFVVTCATCGLSETLTMALGAPPPAAD